MRSWSLHLFRVAGIRLRIHFTFFLLLAWVGWLGYDLGGIPALCWSVMLIATVFLCVVLHEFGHSLVAQRLGVTVHSILLLPVGGVAQMSRIPERPLHEFLIAIAGPLVNVVIAAVLVTFRGWSAWGGDMGAIPDSIGSFADHILRANVMLVVFNLLPAFPMDGGRILRSLLAMKLPFHEATRIAAAIGRFMAVLLMLAGLVINPFLVLIGVFVFWGAGMEARMVSTKHGLEGLAVDRIMKPASMLPADAVLRDCLKELLTRGRADFAVVHGAEIIGWLPERVWRPAIELSGPETPVTAVMQRRFVALRPDTPAVALLDDTTRIGQTSFPVVADGVLVGSLRLEDLAPRLLEPTPGLPKSPGGRWRFSFGN